MVSFNTNGQDHKKKHFQIKGQPFYTLNDFSRMQAPYMVRKDQIVGKIHCETQENLHNRRVSHKVALLRFNKDISIGLQQAREVVSIPIYKHQKVD